MASYDATQKLCQSALSDPQLSPQAVALAATMNTGGSVRGLDFSAATTRLAVWELGRAGHLAGGA